MCVVFSLLPLFLLVQPFSVCGSFVLSVFLFFLRACVVLSSCCLVLVMSFATAFFLAVLHSVVRSLFDLSVACGCVPLLVVRSVFRRLSFFRSSCGRSIVPFVLVFFIRSLSVSLRRSFFLSCRVFPAVCIYVVRSSISRFHHFCLCSSVVTPYLMDWFFTAVLFYVLCRALSFVLSLVRCCAALFFFWLMSNFSRLPYLVRSFLPFFGVVLSLLFAFVLSCFLPPSMFFLAFLRLALCLPLCLFLAFVRSPLLCCRLVFLFVFRSIVRPFDRSTVRSLDRSIALARSFVCCAFTYVFLSCFLPFSSFVRSFVRALFPSLTYCL